MFDRTVVIRGGGDLGSGVALRLWRCGFPVVILETARPVAVRRTVSFSEAVYDGVARVEEAEARRVDAVDVLGEVHGWIPVVVDPEASSVDRLQPAVLVDAVMAKRNAGTRQDMAPVVIGLGPGFTAGEDVHAVVETNRGPNLGRVYWQGTAEPNTGTPGEVRGRGAERVLRAPTAGSLSSMTAIGDLVIKDATIATVGGQAVRAPFDGLVRGLARDGLAVCEGMKIGDLDPRRDPVLCRLVSDKSLAVAGGVLEAVLVGLRDNRA